jgi:hypothetical protein
MPVVVLACDVLQDMIEDLLPQGTAEQVVFFDFGLHAVPHKLKSTLQQAVDSVETPLNSFCNLSSWRNNQCPL